MVAKESKKFFHEKIREYLEDHKDIQFDHAYSNIKNLCLKKDYDISIVLSIFVELLFEKERYAELTGFSHYCLKYNELKFKGDLLKYSFYSSKKLGEVFNTHLIFEDMVAYFISIRNVTPILSEIEEYCNTFPFEFPVLLRRLEAYLSLEQQEKVQEAYEHLKKIIDCKLSKLRGYTRDREKLFKKTLEVFFKYNTKSEAINKIQLELTLSIISERMHKKIDLKFYRQAINTLVEFIVLVGKVNDYATPIVLLDQLAPEVDKSEMIKAMKKCEGYNYLEIIDRYKDLKNILSPKKKVLKEKKTDVTSHNNSIAIGNGPRDSSVAEVSLTERDLLKKGDVIKSDIIMESLIRKKVLQDVTGVEKDLASTFKVMGLNRSWLALERKNDKNK